MRCHQVSVQLVLLCPACLQLPGTSASHPLKMCNRHLASHQAGEPLSSLTITRNKDSSPFGNVHWTKSSNEENVCSSNLVNNSPSEPIETIDIYKTRCTVVIEGKADGTGLASAAMNCSGPGAPVAVLGSTDLKALSADFRVPLPARTFFHCP